MEKYIIIFMAGMSILCYILMGVDKARAKAHGRRVAEKTLFLAAILGGAIGGTMGMFSFRHKTKHWYFRIGFPLIALLQITALWYFFIR